MAMPSLKSLPHSLLCDVLEAATADTGSTCRSLAALALVNRACRNAVTEAGLHEKLATRRFGPLDYGAYFAARGLEDGREPGTAEWRQLLDAMEEEYTRRLSHSIKQASSWLRTKHLLGGSPNPALVAGVGMVRPNNPEDEHSWLHGLILRSPLEMRRRVASYICLTSELHPIKHLDAFLRRFDFRPSEADIDKLGDDEAGAPLAVLQRVLLQFPFLPIDAGGGADRTIGAIARVYVEQLPAVKEWLGHSASTDTGYTEAVHLVIYSLIMLNTDLHNPAVNPKMTVAEFQASLYRVACLRTLAPARIGRLYEAVREAPLRIDPVRAGVDTIIRSSGTEAGEDEVTPALISRHSALRSRIGRVGATVGSLRTAGGRADTRFQLKRWHGRHYTELRVLAMLVVGLCFGYELWSVESEGWLPRGVATALVAVGLHLATRA